MLTCGGAAPASPGAGSFPAPVFSFGAGQEKAGGAAYDDKMRLFCVRALGKGGQAC